MISPPRFSERVLNQPRTPLRWSTTYELLKAGLDFSVHADDLDSSQDDYGRTCFGRWLAKRWGASKAGLRIEKEGKEKGTVMESCKGMKWINEISIHHPNSCLCDVLLHVVILFIQIGQHETRLSDFVLDFPILLACGSGWIRFLQLRRYEKMRHEGHTRPNLLVEHCRTQHWFPRLFLLTFLRHRCVEHSGHRSTWIIMNITWGHLSSAWWKKGALGKNDAHSYQL